MSFTTPSNSANPRIQIVARPTFLRKASDFPNTNPPIAPATAEATIRTTRPPGTSKPKVMTSTIDGLMFGKNSVMSKRSTTKAKAEATVPAMRPEVIPRVVPMRESRMGSSSGLGLPRADKIPIRMGIPSRTMYPMGTNGSIRMRLLKSSIIPMAAVKLMAVPPMRPSRRTYGKSLMPDPPN